MSADFTIETKGSGRGYAWIQTGGLRVYSCYSSRNEPVDRYDAFLGELEQSIRAAPVGTHLVVAGDFNAWSDEWGSGRNDSRGEKLADLAASLELSPINVGNTPTYHRVNAESVIDVTFARLTGQAITGWRVLDQIESASDHRYIEYRLELTDREHGFQNASTTRGWSYRKLNSEALDRYLETVEPPFVGADATASQTADRFAAYLETACNSSMPPRSVARNGRRQVHWWTQGIADLRAESNRLRRIFQRSARHRATPEQTEERREAYRCKKSELRKAVRAAQVRSWADLCKAVDDDPWGIPYKIVTKKIGRNRPGVEARGKEGEIADHLFPAHPAVDWRLEPQTTGDQEQTQRDITLDEIREASRRLPSGKAPGPDGVPNDILRRICQTRPRLLQEVYNACLRSREFPSRWKTARLVLLHKGADKPVAEPSSYRPLCMLDSSGKLLERLLLTRLNDYLDSTGQRAMNQYGFRRGWSTEDAIEHILETARGAMTAAVQHRDLCVVVSLDVRNAFNTAPWRAIDAALRKRRVPQYLNDMLRSYLEDRTLLVGERQTARPVTCGVPQGSVLGPALWNVFYDDLLDLAMPAGVKLVAFADDVSVIGMARTGEAAAAILNPALEAVSGWMSDHGLRLAPQKTEAVVLTTKKRFDNPLLILERHVVPVKESIRYLGVELDTKLSFTRHVAQVSKKATQTARAIGRLMPNLGGPCQAKRALLGSVVNSKLLYAAPTWAKAAIKTAKNRAALARAQRTVALRTIRAYRTVSADATLVLAGALPADIAAHERMRVRDRSEEESQETAASAIREREREISLNAWQARWDRSTKGRWTHRLLPNVDRWLNKPPMSLSFHLTQVLTGHGCFRSYLHRMNRAVDSICTYCRNPDDTVEHTVFYCTHWENHREVMRPFINGRLPVPEDVCDIMCGPESWSDLNPHLRAAFKRARNAFANMVEAIMSTKEADEREAEMHGGINERDH